MSTKTGKRYTIADFERLLLKRLDEKRQEVAERDPSGSYRDQYEHGLASGAVIELKSLLAWLHMQTDGKRGRSWAQFDAEDAKTNQTTTPEQGEEASKQ